MTGKTCEVCGRSIRTGYKYCYEHRYSKHNQTESVFNKAHRQYYHRIKNWFTAGFVALFILMLLEPMILPETTFSRIFFALLVVLLTLIGIALISLVLFVKTRRFFRGETDRINLWEFLFPPGHDNYERFVKNYVERHNIHKEYKKSFFK